MRQHTPACDSIVGAYQRPHPGTWQLATDKPGPGVTSHAFDRRRLWRPAVAGLRSGIGCWGLQNHATTTTTTTTTTNNTRHPMEGCPGAWAGCRLERVCSPSHSTSPVEERDSWIHRPQSANTPRRLRGTAPMAMTKSQSDSRSSAISATPPPPVDATCVNRAHSVDKDALPPMSPAPWSRPRHSLVDLNPCLRMRRTFDAATPCYAIPSASGPSLLFGKLDVHSTCRLDEG
jgi:hypothetical protein